MYSCMNEQQGCHQPHEVSPALPWPQRNGNRGIQSGLARIPTCTPLDACMHTRQAQTNTHTILVPSIVGVTGEGDIDAMRQV